MESKKWYLSKGFWTGVVTTLIGIIAIVDTNFGTHIADQSWYGYIVTLLGALGVYTRVTADTKLTK